jgi:hypothetical protein
MLGQARLRAQAVGISSITTTGNYGTGTSSQTLNGTSTTFYNALLSVATLTDMNGNTYSVSGEATTAILRTDSTSTGELNQTSAWYMGNAQANAGDKPSLLYGSYNSGNPASLLLGNNLLEGSDNLFINSSNPAASGNVERIDFLYNGTTGVAATTGLSVGVFDRGTGDSFSVGIITGVDTHGNPTAYGGYVNVDHTEFTGGGLITTANSDSAILNSGGGEPTDYLVRYDSSTSLATSKVTNDTEINHQNVTGVVFTLASLGITSGTTVYGYSLMGGDVAPGTNLNSLTNYSNPSLYKTNTTDSGAFNGLDPVAVNGVLFTMHKVPEPSTYAEAFLAGALALYGWRRHQRRPAPGSPAIL